MHNFSGIASTVAVVLAVMFMLVQIINNVIAIAIGG